MSVVSGLIRPAISLVNTPVPGPYSIITFAVSKSIDFTIFRAKNLELGAIAPTLRMSLIYSFRKRRFIYFG